jgi:hypothetical protein
VYDCLTVAEFRRGYWPFYSSLHVVMTGIAKASEIKRKSRNLLLIPAYNV